MLNDEEIYRLYQLKRERSRILSSTDFLHFLTYAKQQYTAEWFHRVIARHCQRLLEGEFQNLMVFVPPQHGKLLPADTPILTTEGWKRHGELKYGDEVFGDDGKPKKVLANSGIYDWDVVKLTFQSGYSIESAKEHLWKLQVEYDDHKGRREIVSETQHIYDKRHRRNPAIKCAPALDMPESELPIDPYIFGLWLGDGLKNQGVIASGDEDMEHMAQFGTAKQERLGYWRITIKGLRKALRENGVLYNKHIPTKYLLASKQQREAMLCGLMDTDGTVDKRGNCEFTQKKGKLAEDVYVLIRSLGYKARKQDYTMMLGGRNVGVKTRIMFNPDRDDVVFKLKRKADRLKNKTNADREDKKKFFLQSVSSESRRVKGNCIQVEGGMYLAGYDMIPTHNSEIVSRMFPAWALGRDPNTKIVGCSYSATLAEGFSRSVQRTIDSTEYQSVFPDTYLNGTEGKGTTKGYLRNADYFEIVGHSGFYKSVGVCGGLTGTPVDIAIIDDPVKDALEANSAVYRERVWEWYNTVLLTRLHNSSKQLFIMTRWHEDDLAGRILKRQADKWKVLTIPALCEVEGDGGMSDRHIGDALWEERHSKEKLLQARENAPREFNALYQQHPTIEGGNIVKRDWFKMISQAEFRSLRFKEVIYFYLDTAYNKRKEKVDNDPSGILGACKIGNNIYIVNATKVWKEMPDLLKFIPEYMSANGATNESKLNVEPKANGVSVIQMMQEYTGMNVKATPTPTDSKEARFRAVSPRIECGRVYVVEGDWNEDFFAELCAFPNAPHDEFVDILGYAIDDLLNNEEVDFSGLDKSFFGL